jgi:hypothetical protein
LLLKRKIFVKNARRVRGKPPSFFFFIVVRSFLSSNRRRFQKRSVQRPKVREARFLYATLPRDDAPRGEKEETLVVPFSSKSTR